MVAYDSWMGREESKREEGRIKESGRVEMAKQWMCGWKCTWGDILFEMREKDE